MNSVSGRANPVPIIAGEKSPVFSGDYPDEDDWQCPECDTLLATGVHERQIVDMAFRCPSCQIICEMPPLLPGQPLCGRGAMFPPGEYALSETVFCKTSQIASKRAVDQYHRETGFQWMSSPGSLKPSLEPSFLRRLAKELRAVLGDRYVALEAVDARGQSSSTPPKHRHRLMELSQYAEEAASLLEQHADGKKTEINADLLAELTTTVDLFRRWRFHPAWDRLVSALVDPVEVQHTVMLLTAASFFVDATNGVGIVDDVGTTTRIPDIWIEPTLSERLDLEVKTPLFLRGPLNETLDLADCEKKLETLIDKAASSKSGQLNPGHSGLIVIGGYHLGRANFAIVKKSIERIVKRQKGRKPHLAGVALFQLSYDLSETQTSRSMTPVLLNELILHPTYNGSLTIQRGLPQRPNPLL